MNYFRLITIITILFCASTVRAQQYDAFHPGKLWLDMEGRPINAHGGGVLYYQGTYYWFGEHKGEESNRADVGVTCYSSQDLYNWRFESIALPVSSDEESPVVKGSIIERPKVIFNEKSQKFVMYFHLELKGQGYNAAQVGVAISDRVTGPYHLIKNSRVNADRWPINLSDSERTSSVVEKNFKQSWTPEWVDAVAKGMFLRRDFKSGQMARDMTLFVDDDHKAYHIYASEDNGAIHIAELTDNYQGYTGKYVRLFPAKYNEAPAIFKKGGVYWMITSGCTGWKPNAARMFSAPSIWGPWTAHENPCIGPDADLTFHSQSTYILPVQGKPDTFIFMADRWMPSNPIDGRYVWLPILFEDGKPVLKWQDKWRLNGTTYYLDADRGKDEQDGLSAETPWKSLEKVNQISLRPGDRILLKRGSVFHGTLTVQGRGTANRPIVIDAYGQGDKPRIVAPDGMLYAVQIKNAAYLTMQHLDVSNHGSQRMPYRTGVKVLCEDFGVSKCVTLRALDVHDVNGSLIKHDGGGSGILIANKWKTTVSRFDSLLIEDCTIRRCERNGIIWSAPWDRSNWHPSINTIVRRNLIEQVPGDGIVPIGCDGALVEYNVMRNCPPTLPKLQAAAGIWPWSCDNTVIQFNEVSDHKAPWDGQGFDSDFNCTNTTIRYNYSHDNDGGFVLICNAGKATQNVGNIGTKVEYNISINDAIRPHETHAGVFSPSIHIGGPVKDTHIKNNIIHILKKPNTLVDRHIITADTWDGYPDSTFVEENIFFTEEPVAFKPTQSTHHYFSGNYYLGPFKDKPTDSTGRYESSVYSALLSQDVSAYKALQSLMREVNIADGAAKVYTVDVDAIKHFFNQVNNSK